MGPCSCVVGCLGAGAGVCARRRTYFLLLRQKKVGKEKATPLRVSPSLRYGATCGARSWCGTAELTSRCALRSNNRSESEHEARASFGARARPTPCAPRHAQRGGETTRAIAALGLAHAAQSARALGAERSDGPYGLQTPCGCACGAGLAGWRVQRSMHALRRLTRRGCLNAARSAQ